MAHAAAMAKAAKDAGVKHVIWSTLEDSRKWIPLSDNRMPTLQGKYKVPHFDAKGEAEPLLHGPRRPDDVPVHVVLLGQLHLLRHGPEEGPRRHARPHDADGRQEAPGHRRRGHRRVRVRDLQGGREVHRKDRRHRRRAPDRRADGGRALEGARPRGRYNAVSPDVYRGFGFPGADDMGNMFQFNRDFSDDFCAARSVEFSRSLHPGLQSYDQWLARNAKRIPLE